MIDSSLVLRFGGPNGHAQLECKQNGWRKIEV